MLNRNQINRRFWAAMNVMNTLNTMSLSGQEDWIAENTGKYTWNYIGIANRANVTSLGLRDCIEEVKSRRDRIERSSDSHFWTFDRYRSNMRSAAICWRQYGATHPDNHDLVIFEDYEEGELRPTPIGPLTIKVA